MVIRGGFVLLMINFGVVMILRTSHGCLGNWCRQVLRCLHQFSSVCIWPSGGRGGFPIPLQEEGVFLVLFRSAEGFGFPSFWVAHLCGTRVAVFEVAPRLGRDWQ